MSTPIKPVKPPDLTDVGGPFAGKTEPLPEALGEQPERAAPASPTPQQRPRPNKSARQGRALRLDDVEPWPDPVDGPAIFSDVLTTLGRYVVLPGNAPAAIALWAALTYLTDVVDVLPRLLVTSPTRACGKSRLLALLGAIVRRPLPASSITPSAVFRVIEAAHPTLLLDELDNARLDENAELRAILNSGHERSNAWTVRNVGEQHEARHFSTWAPVAFASIGRLPDTVASRCITVGMRRRVPSEKVERLRGSRLSGELEHLRRRLARWCQDHAEAVRDSDPTLPALLEDREADNWTPLLAIADAIAGHWPILARRAAEDLAGAKDNEAAAVLLLGDLRDLFQQRKVACLASEDVVAALVAIDSRPWPEWYGGKPITKRGVARLLAPFGVQSRNLRLRDRVVKGYDLSDLRESFARYLRVSSATTLRAAPAAGETSILDALHIRHVADGENTASTNNDGPRSAVADIKPSEAGVGDESPLEEGPPGWLECGELEPACVPSVPAEESLSLQGQHRRDAARGQGGRAGSLEQLNLGGDEVGHA